MKLFTGAFLMKGESMTSNDKSRHGTLISYGESTDNIFKLFGTDENAITKSLSWSLSKSSELTKSIIQKAFGKIDVSDEYVVFYQRYSHDNGITDIEITDNVNFHIIIEAKKGWTLPKYEQLNNYATRPDFCDSLIPYKKIITMSECSQQYADHNLIKAINGISIIHMSWNAVFKCAQAARKASNNANKKMLDELCLYLEEVIGMQNYLSNEVYCVSLSRDPIISDCSLCWLDIVLKYHKYTFPQGNSWPVEPPNYIAFRYDGKLQSIHHVESYVLTKNINEYIPEYPDITYECPHFVVSLGEAIIPSKEVKSGKTMWAKRVWAMFDLLLTCNTVEEAAQKSKERKNRLSAVIK